MKFLEIVDLDSFIKYFNLNKEEFLIKLSIENFGRNYYSFDILKKNGSKRRIDAPAPYLANIQVLIAKELLLIYKPKKCVHAFCKNRSIKSNASKHKRSKFVVNLDLKDFYNSIHVGRVTGMFQSFPFNFNIEVSKLLSKICCFRNKIPQGAATSPIISNFICRSPDREFSSLAEALKCHYTRYADDITFSTRKSKLPLDIGNFETEIFQLSTNVKRIIKTNSFVINETKVRCQDHFQRQVVTGLVVNRKVNVNRNYIKITRAILNAIEKYGITAAMNTHFQKNNIEKGAFKNPVEYFLKRIVGKISFIGFIRGKDDKQYINLFSRIKKIYPKANLSIILNEVYNTDNNYIITEGKTDWKHMKAALDRFRKQGKFLDLNIKFHENENTDIGDEQLIQMCRSYAKGQILSHKMICIFDRDVPTTTKKVTEQGHEYKYWGNNVYSFILPKPEHVNFNNISIEHMYLDHELKTMDENGRRIFTSDEFDVVTYKHRKESCYFKGTQSQLQPNFGEGTKIISDKVFNEGNNSLALSKSNFANNIYHQKGNFQNFNIDAFEKLYSSLSILTKYES